MTQPTPSSATPATAPKPKDNPAETFLAITVRRSRYLVAVGICASLYLTLGWMAVRPAADSSGISLLVQNAGLMGSITLLVLTVLCVALSTWICHPDSPYAGLWCTLLGLGALAIRGGTIQEMLRWSQEAAHAPAFYKTLAIECVHWATLVIAADLTARFVWSTFFPNTTWIARSGLDPGHMALETRRGAGLPGKDDQRIRSAVWMDSAVAIALTCGIAYVLISLFLQTHLKGQVLVGLFLSFGIAACLARLASPFADPLAFWLSVPLTAAIGYLLVNSDVAVGFGSTAGQMLVHGRPAPANALVFPGHALSPLGRALPIDYIAAGVPGAIIGYFAAVRVHLHNVHERAKEAGE